MQSADDQDRLPDPEGIAADSEPPLTAGSCILKRPVLAEIVQKAILHFEGERYRLGTWSIMPNHVHLVIQPMPGFALKAILGSCKSYSSRRINSRLTKGGPLWERQSFDHLISSDGHIEDFIKYVDDILSPPACASAPRTGRSRLAASVSSIRFSVSRILARRHSCSRGPAGSSCTCTSLVASTS